MSLIPLFKSGNKQETIVKIIKIAILFFVGIFLIGNFNPYFEGSDSYSYALTAKQLSQGNLFYTHDFLETREDEFTPHDVMITQDGKNALPSGYAGFFGITTASYILAGNYGLFYFGPIAGIIFLIVCERVSTNLFGKYVGLLTLLFLATNHLFYRSSLELQTESIFSIFAVMGCYFLIKFFQTNNDKYILGCSTFLVISTLMRTNGIIYFPLELGLLFGFFIIIKIKSKTSLNKINPYSKILTKFSSLNKKRIIKIFFLAIIPWLIFLIFYFSYFGYFYDDPLTNRVIVAQGEDNHDVKLSSLLSLESKTFDNAKQYSKWLLPFQFPRIVDATNYFSTVDDIFGNNWLGILALSVLGFFLIFSLYKKNNLLTMIIFTTIIVGTVWFFSALTSEERALERALPGRYMFPAFSLFYMMLGFMIIKFLKFSNIKKSDSFKILPIIKISSVSFLVVFFLLAFHFSPPIQAIYHDEFRMENPIELNQRYPLDTEGLSKNDILISINFEAIDYGLIQFKATLNDKEISQKSLDLLKKTIEDDYDFYILKNPSDPKDLIIYKNLAEQSELIIKDYSESFCKVELLTKDQKESNQFKNDVKCFNY